MRNKIFFLFLILVNFQAQAQQTCHSLLSSQPNFEEASKNLKAFRDSIASQMLEREYVVEPILLGLLAKEHVLLIGPPGNAKTTLVKKMLTNVIDGQSGKPSFYSMQMNKEITLADTHGSINFKTLSEEGVVKRNYQEGMLGARLAFTDESFDIRPGALRNLLDVLAERSHSQGTSHHKGLTEVVISATNKTLPEVYEEHNNSEAPRALVDRYSFVVFVPKEMQSLASDRAIFKGLGSDRNNKPIHTLKFEDLDALRDLVKKVEVPDYISDLASLIHFRLTPLYEAQEVKSMEEYREKVQNGEHSLPPFRASKYMSPRTLSKAGNILRAIVVLDYIEKNGQRSLIATTNDLSKLRLFYQINGPKDEFITLQMGRALKEHEKEQIKAVQTERSIANPVFDNVIKEFNETINGLRLQDIDLKVKGFQFLPKDESRQLVELIKALYIKGLFSLKAQTRDEVTPETISYSALLEIVREYAKVVFKDKAASVLEKWEREMSDKDLTEIPRDLEPKNPDEELPPHPNVKLTPKKLNFHLISVTGKLAGLENSKKQNYLLIGEKFYYEGTEGYFNTSLDRLSDQSIASRSWGKNFDFMYPHGKDELIFLAGEKHIYLTNISKINGKDPNSDWMRQEFSKINKFYKFDQNNYLVIDNARMTFLKFRKPSEIQPKVLADNDRQTILDADLYPSSENNFVAITDQGELKLWDMTSPDQAKLKKNLKIKEISSGSTSKIRYLDSNHILITSETKWGQLQYVYNILKEQYTQVHFGPHSYWELSPDRRTIAVISGSEVKAYSAHKLTDGGTRLENGQTVGSFKGLIGLPLSLRFFNDGKDIIVKFTEGFAHIRDRDGK